MLTDLSVVGKVMCSVDTVSAYFCLEHGRNNVLVSGMLQNENSRHLHEPDFKLLGCPAVPEDYTCLQLRNILV